MAIDYQRMRYLLDVEGHPVTGPYSADAKTAADQMNAVNVPAENPLIWGIELANLTDEAEFLGLNKDDQNRWIELTNMPSGSFNMNNGTGRAMLESLFNPGSTTRDAVEAKVGAPTSVSIQEGFGEVKKKDVEYARSLPVPV